MKDVIIDCVSFRHSRVDFGGSLCQVLMCSVGGRDDIWLDSTFLMGGMVLPI